MYSLHQVVITDVDECLEALLENVSVNLPSHCTLVPSCLSHEHKTAAIASHPASVSQPAATPSSEGQAIASETSCSCSRFANQTAAAQEPSTVAGNRNLSSSNGAVQQHSADNQSGSMCTEVLVAELDWGQDASGVAPPFDVVLVADVVSLSTSIGRI